MSEGQPGLPGLPGEPGTQGGGAGGTGGQGGKGGAGGGKIGQRRALIGYILIVLIAVALVEVQTIRTTNDLSRHDERSCAQRNRLATNQRAVLAALTQVMRLEIDEQGEHVGERNLLLANLADLNRRALLAGPEEC